MPTNQLFWFLHTYLELCSSHNCSSESFSVSVALNVGEPLNLSRHKFISYGNFLSIIVTIMLTKNQVTAFNY